MAVWLKELGIVIAVFIVVGLECLFVLIAYYKYENWRYNRKAVAKNPNYGLGEVRGKKRKDGVINSIVKNLQCNKNDNGGKNPTPHQKELYH
jgi:hypothetical protein